MAVLASSHISIRCKSTNIFFLIQTKSNLRIQLKEYFLSYRKDFFNYLHNLLEPEITFKIYRLHNIFLGTFYTENRNLCPQFFYLMSVFLIKEAIFRCTKIRIVTWRISKLLQIKHSYFHLDTGKKLAFKLENSISFFLKCLLRILLCQRKIINFFYFFGNMIFGLLENFFFFC